MWLKKKLCSLGWMDREATLPKFMRPAWSVMWFNGRNHCRGILAAAKAAGVKYAPAI